MTTWVDAKTPTTWKWVAVVVGFVAGTGLATSPVYVALGKLQGWPLWVVAAGTVITLLATFVLQTYIALAVLVLVSFAFCVNVDNGHVFAWALAWLATGTGALIANSFIVDMSWLYHWSKARDESADN